MQKMGSAVILIILGIIIITFPLLGVVPLGILTGLTVLFLGIGLLLTGIVSLGESTAILELVLGVLAIILGIGFIVNPALFSFVAALFVFIAGIFLIIAGIAALATKVTGSRISGLITLLLGIIYVILAYFIKNPLFLGILIGVWLLIAGILMTLQKDE